MSVLYSNWSSTWYPSGSSVARKIRARLTYSLTQDDTSIIINAQGAVCVYKDNLTTTINGTLTLGSSSKTGSHSYTYNSSKGGGNTETYYTITALNSSATYQKKENSYTVTITLKASRGSSNATSVSTTITIPALNKKTVSFYDENVLINTQSVTQGSTATYLDLPDRDGKHLVNWLSGSTSGNAYNFSTPVNTDLNLYASWANNNYTITFKSSNSGIPVKTGQTRYDVQSCTVGKPITLNSVGNIFDNTFSNNYLFLGWSREPNGEIVFTDEEEFTVEQEQGKKQISENFNINNGANNILYAVWVNKYIKPTIKNLNVYRSSTSGLAEIEDETGTHAHISLYVTKGKQNQLVSGTFDYETVELQTNIKIEYKLTGTDQYTLFSNETITNEGEYTKVITGPLDMSSYDILVTVFTPSPSSLSIATTDVLSAASFIIDIDSSGRGIGIFSVAPKSEEVIKNTVSINGVLNLGEAVTDNNRLFINNNGLECYYGGNSVFQIGVSEAVSQPTIETYSKQEIYDEQSHYKDYELDATPSGSFTIRGTFATKYENSMVFTVSPEQYSIQQPFEFTFDSYVLNDSKTLGNVTVTLQNVNGSPGFRISYNGGLYRYGEALMMSLSPILPGEICVDFMNANHPPIDGGYVSNYNGYTGIYENLIVRITNNSDEVLATVEVPPTQAYNTTLTDLNLTIDWDITNYSFSFTNNSNNTYKITTISYSYAAGVFYNVQAVYSISDQEPTLTIGSRLASQYGANSATIGTGLVATIPNQLVIGQYNVPDDPTTSDGYPFIIGNGDYTAGIGVTNSNAFMIDWGGDIYPQGQKMTDFIIEQGISGDWTYRKWKSGKCEAWWMHDYEGTQYAFTTSGGSGRYYYYNSTWVSANLELPKNSNDTYVFASVNGAWCNISTNAYISSEVASYKTTGDLITGLVLRVWTPYSATVTFNRAYVYVVGAWT